MTNGEKMEEKKLETATLTVSVKYKDAFLPDCGVRFRGASFDSGPIMLTRDAFPIEMNVPIKEFTVTLKRPWKEPGDKPVIGAEIGLEDFEGPRELVFIIVDGKKKSD